MTEKTSHIEGQIEAPNPLELFWDKNKRIVQFGLVAAGLAIAIKYGLQYQERVERDNQWSEFATSTALDKGYTESRELWQFYSNLVREQPGMLAQYLLMANNDLGSMVLDDLEQADVPGLEKLAAGTDGRAPLARWALAGVALGQEDWDGAIGQLEQLRADFPDHFFCRESEFPVQYLPEVERDDDEDDAKADTRPPEYEPPQAGSQVGRMIAAIQAEKQFRAANERLYLPQEPDSAETVIFKVADYGDIKIKLFTSKAPKHVARFLALADEGWWAGQRVHEVRRKGDFHTAASAPSELIFGWPATREDSAADWNAEDVAEENQLDWEPSDLSHFPGTVAVELVDDGKSQVERISIVGTDQAASLDGSRVIIGRVVEGLDVVIDIIRADFADEASSQSGSGRPLDLITIESVSVER